ncbi:hypothetical protein ACVWWJ_002477 [Luteibacter sp. HA06]
MATRKAQKRIYLLRADFAGAAAAGINLQSLLQQAVAALPVVNGAPNLNATTRDSPNHGQLRINQLSVNGTSIEVKVVALAPGENATIVPLALQPNQNAEDSALPPDAMAFKGGDFFLLIEGNNVLCVGDHLRLGPVESYLRDLFGHVLPGIPDAAAFEIRPVARHNKVKMLADEGIKAIELNSSLYAATLDQPTKGIALLNPFREALDGILDSARALIDQDESEDLNEHLADVQVKLLISVKGGLRGPESSRAAVEALGQSLVSDGAPAEDEDISPVLITNRKNRVSVSEASVSENFGINRRNSENSLLDTEVWAILRSYRETLHGQGTLDE